MSGAALHLTYAAAYDPSSRGLGRTWDRLRWAATGTIPLPRVGRRGAIRGGIPRQWPSVRMGLRASRRWQPQSRAASRSARRCTTCPQRHRTRRSARRSARRGRRPDGNFGGRAGSSKISGRAPALCVRAPPRPCQAARTCEGRGGGEGSVSSSGSTCEQGPIEWMRVSAMLFCGACPVGMCPLVCPL